MSISVTLRARPVEELLKPTLAVVASASPIHIRWIIRYLVREGIIAAADGRFGDEITSEVGQSVVEATIKLKESGLIKPVSPGTWQITSAGRRQLAKEEPITFDVLKRRPQYRNYLGRLAAENRRRDWQELRFDYYVAGRALSLQGSFNAAPLLLAYAVEYSLKAALAEAKGVPRALTNSHDFVQLYQACLERSLLTSTRISNDFLKFVQDHFERRYPTLQAALLARRKRWSFGPALLATYDDCMIQVDCALDEIYGSSHWSLGNKALTTPASEMARAFFHDNVFAIDRLEEYRTSVREPRFNYPDPNYLDRAELVFSASEHLPYPSLRYETARKLLSLDLAGLFIYPEVGAPDPDPVRILEAGRRSLVSSALVCEWVVVALRKEFGGHAVEIVEEREARRVVVIVYERRAIQYWAPLELVRGGLPLLFENQQSRRALVNWIRRVKEVFGSGLRQVRDPSG